MTLFYRSADVLITDRSFTVRDPHPARYAIAELAFPRVVVGEWHPAGRRARSHELWVTYRHRHVCLFRTLDERRFGQVRRGLVRALEHRQRWFEERDGWSAHEIER